MMATHHEPYLFKKKHSQKLMNQSTHDDVIKWKHFPRYWTFVRGIHRSPVNSSHKGQWRGALMFSLIWARINGWVNKGEAGELRRYCPHYDVNVMQWRRIFNLGNLGNYIRARFFSVRAVVVWSGFDWVWRPGDNYCHKTGYPQIKSTGTRSSSELQWLDKDVVFVYFCIQRNCVLSVFWNDTKSIRNVVTDTWCNGYFVWMTPENMLLSSSRVITNYGRITSWDGVWFRIHDLWFLETLFVPVTCMIFQPNQANERTHAV